MTDVAYKPLTVAENIFKAVVWDPLIMAGESALFTAVPILAAPVLGTIDQAIITAISNWLFERIRLVVDVTAIQFVNSVHQTAYQSAAIKLAVIAHDKGIDSDEFKKAREDAKIALSHFVRFGSQ